MSLLSNAPPETKTETPAKEGGQPDPKAADVDPKSSPGGEKTADPSESGGAGDKKEPSAPAKAGSSKAKEDFEQRLEELATLDLSVKERAKEIEKAKAKLDRFTPIDDHLTKKEFRQAVKALLGEAYTPELLLDLADDFAPPELSVEDRVKKTLEEERKKQEEDQKKKDEETAAANKAAVETETKAYLSATAAFLRANQDKFPLIVAWDDYPDIDHEAMIDKCWRDHYAKTGEVPDPEKVLEAIEGRHLGRIKKTRFAPREEREATLEEHAGNTRPAEIPAKPAPAPPAAGGSGYKTGVEEAYANLEAYEREQEQRKRLSYGR